MKSFKSSLQLLLRLFVVIQCFGLAASASAATSQIDPLVRQKVKFKSADPLKVFNATIDAPRDIFERFQPGLDSSMTVVHPLQISGSRQTPRAQVSIQKCVLVICQTVDLDATVTISPARGKCDANYVMVADLARSSQTLTDVYDAILVDICFTKTADGGMLDLSAGVRRSGTYSDGIVQQEIFKVLKMQVTPITRAINETLAANGAGH